MSQQGITPPIPQTGSQGSAGATQARDVLTQTAKIERLPEKLSNTERPVRTEGRIIDVLRNRIARIQTAQGRVDVQLDPDAPAPKEGQKVTLDIPPGKPPKEAKLTTQDSSTRRRGKAAGQNTQSQPRSGETVQRPSPQAPRTDTTIRNAETVRIQKTQQTPVTYTRSGTQPRAQQASQPPPQLNQGDIIRLSPLPTQTAQSSTANAGQTQTQQQAVQHIIQTLSNTLAGNSPAQLAASIEQILQSANIDLKNGINIPKAAFATHITDNPDVFLKAIFEQFTTVLQFQAQIQTQSAQNNTVDALLRNLLGLSQPGQTTPNTRLQSTPAQNLQHFIQNGLPQATQPLNIPQQAIQKLQAPLQTVSTPAPNSPSTTAQTPIQSLLSPTQPLQIRITGVTLPQPVLQATTAQAQPNITQIVQNNGAQTLLRSNPPTPIAQSFLPTAPATSSLLTGISSQFSGIITGFDSAGRPILTLNSTGGLSNTSFAVNLSGKNLPLGTQIRFMPMANTAGAEIRGAALPPLNVYDGFEWPALKEALQVLTQAGNNSIQNLTQLLPRPVPAQFVTGVLFFIAAMKAGDFTTWFGEKNLEILRRDGRMDIISRLGRDFTTAGRRAAEPISGEWRPVPIPLYMDSDIAKIQIFVRDQYAQDGSDDDKDGQKKTRFIMDLELSRMGPMQVDGLLREQRLDLVLRTEQPFSTEMRQALRQKYSLGLRAAQLTGDLEFRGSKEGWIEIELPKDELGVSA